MSTTKNMARNMQMFADSEKYDEIEDFASAASTNAEYLAVRPLILQWLEAGEANFAGGLLQVLLSNARLPLYVKVLVPTAMR